jgi:hypothetical protein
LEQANAGHVMTESSEPTIIPPSSAQTTMPSLAADLLNGVPLHSRAELRDSALIWPNAFTVRSIAHATGAVEQTVPASQYSMNNDYTAHPALGYEGNIICDRDGCEGISFSKRSDWK